MYKPNSGIETESPYFPAYTFVVASQRSGEGPERLDILSASLREHYKEPFTYMRRIGTGSGHRVRAQGQSRNLVIF